MNPKHKTKHQVQNWPEYERGLRARGDVTIWLAEEAIRAWTPPPSRRRGGLRRRQHDGPIHLIVDSAGLKLYGAGEWCSREHRKAGERGGWRKCHIGVDNDGLRCDMGCTCCW